MMEKFTEIYQIPLSGFLKRCHTSNRLTGRFHFLTLSSPLATLNDSSTTLPAAMRDAVEVCDSFQMVSLSTCRRKEKKKYCFFKKKQPSINFDERRKM